MKSWYRIENRAEPDLAQVYLYDEIGAFGVTAGEFVNDLRAIDAAAIELHINSPGGGVFDGMAMYNAIRNHPASVNVVVDGIAASAASFVAMAGDTVKAETNARLMIHDAINGVAGNASDLREIADLLDKFSDDIADIYADRAGGTRAQWRDLMRATTWYSAAEAKGVGLVDEVIGRKSRALQPVNRWDFSMFEHGSRLSTSLFQPANVDPPPEPTPADPPDEAGFLMPDIRGPIEALAEIPWDADLFRAAVAVVANDSPAPDSPPPSVPDSPEPEFSINLPDLRRAMKEARL